MPNLENEKPDTVEKNPPADLRPPTSSPEEVDIEDDTNTFAMMRAQGRKKKVENLPWPQEVIISQVLPAPDLRLSGSSDMLRIR